MQKIIFIILIIFSSNLISKETFEINQIAFSLEVDKNWDSVLKNTNNLYLLRKSNDDSSRDKPKSVLFVSNTTLKGVTFNEKAMRAQVDTYILGRERYLKGKEATIERFVPLELVKNENDLSFYIIGVDYQIGIDRYFERSMFVICAGSTFHLKSLDFSSTDALTSAFQLGKTLKCAN